MEKGIYTKESLLKQIKQTFLHQMLTVLFAENGNMLSSKKKQKNCIIVVNYAGIYFYRSKGLRHIPELKAEFSVYDVQSITYIDQKTRMIKSKSLSVTYTTEHIDESVEKFVFARSILLEKSQHSRNIQFENFPKILNFHFSKPEEAINLTVLRYVCLSVRAHTEPSPDIIKLYKRIKSHPNQTLVFDDKLDIPCDIHSIADPITVLPNITTVYFKKFIPYAVCRLAHYFLKHSNSIRTLIFEGYNALLPLQLELAKLTNISTPVSFIFNSIAISGNQLLYLFEEIGRFPGEYQRISFNRITISGNMFQSFFDNMIESRATRTLEFFEMNHIDFKSNTINDKFIEGVQNLLKHCRFLDYVSFSQWPEPIPLTLDIFLSHNILSDISLCKQDMTQVFPNDLKFPNHVHFLNFSNCSFTFNSLVSLFTIISQHNSPLSLLLGDIQLPESHWRLLFDSLPSLTPMKCIHELDWSGNIIDYQSMKQFSTYFVEQTSLHYLIIDRIFGSNQIEDFKSLISVLPRNKLWGLSIRGDTQKNLSGNFKVFLDSIETLMPFYFLNLNGQQINEQDADILVDFLKRNKDIVDISCDSSQISCEHNLFVFYDDLFKIDIKSIGRPVNDIKRLLGINLSNLAKPDKWSDFRSKISKHYSTASRLQLSSFLCRINLQDTINLDQYFEFLGAYPKAYFELDQIDIFNLSYHSPKGIMSSIYQISNKEPFTSLQKLHSEMLQSPLYPLDRQKNELKHYGSVINFEKFTNPVVTSEVPQFISDVVLENDGSENSPNITITNAKLKSVSTAPLIASIEPPFSEPLPPQNSTDLSMLAETNSYTGLPPQMESTSTSTTNSELQSSDLNLNNTSQPKQESKPNQKDDLNIPSHFYPFHQDEFIPSQQFFPTQHDEFAPSQQFYCNPDDEFKPLQPLDSNQNSEFKPLQPSDSNQNNNFQPLQGNNDFQTFQQNNFNLNDGFQPLQENNELQYLQPFQPLESISSEGLQPLQPFTGNNDLQPLQPLQPITINPNEGLQLLQPLEPISLSNGLSTQPLPTMPTQINQPPQMPSLVPEQPKQPPQMPSLIPEQPQSTQRQPIQMPSLIPGPPNQTQQQLPPQMPSLIPGPQKQVPPQMPSLLPEPNKAPPLMPSLVPEQPKKVPPQMPSLLPEPNKAPPLMPSLVPEQPKQTPPQMPSLLPEPNKAPPQMPSLLPEQPKQTPPQIPSLLPEQPKQPPIMPSLVPQQHQTQPIPPPISQPINQTPQIPSLTPTPIHQTQQMPPPLPQPINQLNSMPPPIPSPFQTQQNDQQVLPPPLEPLQIPTIPQPQQSQIPQPTQQQKQPEIPQPQQSQIPQPTQQQKQPEIPQIQQPTSTLQPQQSQITQPPQQKQPETPQQQLQTTQQAPLQPITQQTTKSHSRFASSAGSLSFPFLQASSISLPKGPTTFKLPNDQKEASLLSPTKISDEYNKTPPGKKSNDSLEIEDVLVFSKNASNQAPPPMSVLSPDFSAVDSIYNSQQPPYQEFALLGIKEIPQLVHPLQSRVRIPPPQVSICGIPSEW